MAQSRIDAIYQYIHVYIPQKQRFKIFIAFLKVSLFLIQSNRRWLKLIEAGCKWVVRQLPTQYCGGDENLRYVSGKGKYLPQNQNPAYAPCSGCMLAYCTQNIVRLTLRYGRPQTDFTNYDSSYSIDVVRKSVGGFAARQRTETYRIHIPTKNQPTSLLVAGFLDNSVYRQYTEVTNRADLN